MSRTRKPVDDHRAIESATSTATQRGFRQRWLVAVGLGLVVIVSLAAWNWTRSKQLIQEPSGNVSQGESSSHTSGSTTRPAADDMLTSLPKLPTRKPTIELEETVWQSESLHESTLAQLKRLARLMETASQQTAETLDPIITPDFTSGALRPAQLEEVFRDSSLLVHRGADSAVEASMFQGAAGLSTAMAKLAQAWDGATNVHVKFKQFRVEMSDAKEVPELSTTAYLDVSAHGNERSVGVNAIWDCQWHADAAGNFRLRSVAVREHEETSLRADEGALFSDSTEAVLGQTAAYRRELVYGMDHWLARREFRFGATYHGHHGLAIADVNGDGLEDVYVCQLAGLPNRLFLQNIDGTVREVSQAAQVDILDSSRCALFVDLDNDSDQDLIVALTTGLLVLSNDGQGVFDLEKSLPQIQGSSTLAAADYDGDGDLDIYVCVYSVRDDDTAISTQPVPYHDANNGTANALLRNDGSWNFSDVTDAVGLNENNQRFSFAAAWEDYDNDGDSDLYVANDFGRNNLYRNDDGMFRDVAAAAGVEDISAGMSVTWGDYNQDGLMDLYVSNMFSSAGNRVAYQRQFKPSAESDARANFQRHARGNSLFENQGDGTFRDVSQQAAVTMGRWAWASLFVDINNDSYEDLVVANGLRTGIDAGDL